MKIALRIRKGVLFLSAAFLSLVSVARACQIASAESSIIDSSFQLQWYELASLPLLARDQLTWNELMTKFKPLPLLERLMEVFEINEDGCLTWRQKPHSKCWRINSGDVAGAAKEDGYWRVTLDGSHYYCHRILWKISTGMDPAQNEVDHINRDRSDNRISNLRVVTTWQNSLNRKGGKTSATEEQCIFPTGRNRSPFKVVINGKHIGSFSSMPEAIQARDECKLAILAEEGML